MIFLRRKITSFIATTVLCCSAVLANSGDPDGEGPQPHILVVGDSLSAAYNMELRQAWPSLLQARLQQDGYVWQVFNSSITGDTTEGGLARLPRLLERYRPAIVIIELGGNDGLRGLPLDVTRSNLSQMIQQSKNSGAQVILTGIRIPPNYGTAFVREFELMYAELAGEYETGLVPFFMEGVALVPGMMQADGVHPSIQAQPVLLDNVWPEIEALLQRQSPSAGKGD